MDNTFYLFIIIQLLKQIFMIMMVFVMLSKQDFLTILSKK